MHYLITATLLILLAHDPQSGPQLLPEQALLDRDLRNSQAFISELGERLKFISQNNGYTLNESSIHFRVYPGGNAGANYIGMGLIYFAMGGAVLYALAMGTTLLVEESSGFHQTHSSCHLRDCSNSSNPSLYLSFQIEDQDNSSESLEGHCYVTLSDVQSVPAYNSNNYFVHYRIRNCTPEGAFPNFNGVVAVGNFYFDAVEFLQKKLWPYIDSLYAEVDSMLEEADKIQGPGGSQYATRRARQMRDRARKKESLLSP